MLCSRIADNLHEFLPNLESIILTGNNIQDFGDLDPLLQLPKLETLSLLTNPITTDPHYREYIAYKWVYAISNLMRWTIFIIVCVCVFHCDRFPKLRLLDFRKIRQKDRQAAVELFRSKKGKEILKEIAKKARAAAANPAAAESNSSKGESMIHWQLTAQKDYYFYRNGTFYFLVPSASSEDVQKIRDAIKNATSLEEVERLTRILQSGNIPENLNAENGNGNGKMNSVLVENFHWLLCLINSGVSHADNAMEM